MCANCHASMSKPCLQDLLPRPLGVMVLIILVEKLQLNRVEAESFFHSQVPLEKGASGHPACDPLNGDHVTMLSNEGCVIMLADKVVLDAWSSRGRTISLIHVYQLTI